MKRSHPVIKYELLQTVPTGIRTHLIFLRMKNQCSIGKDNCSLLSSQSNTPMIKDLCLQ